VTADGTNGVEIRHLQAFIAVAEEASFTRAAERLTVTQPALSRTVAQLERLVRSMLLYRTPQVVELTEAGERFLSYARKAVATVEEGVIAMRGYAVLRVAFAWPAAGERSSQIFRAFEAEQPGARIEPRRCDNPMMELADGRAHLVFLRSTPDDPRFGQLTLFRERRVAAVSADHPLAGRESVRLADLAGDPLVLNVVSGTTTAALWDNADPDRKIVETHNLDEWLESVAVGHGIGITPESSTRLHPHPWVTYIPLADAPPVPVVLVWPMSGQHPLCAAFIEVAQRHGRAPAAR
jgi:DNA-binding transcriptional LysR family regulator